MFAGEEMKWASGEWAMRYEARKGAVGQFCAIRKQRLVLLNRHDLSVALREPPLRKAEPGHHDLANKDIGHAAP
jgi:hypothetical protein